MYIPIYFAAACNSGNTSGLISANGLPKTCAEQGTINTAFLVLFTIIGGIAFLFLVIGGTRYVMSQGNPENIQKAKNQIQYSLIGLIITALAAAIVNFVIGRF